MGSSELYDDAARERWLPEAAKSTARSEFERDRARVVHSAALRRLHALSRLLGIQYVHGDGDTPT